MYWDRVQADWAQFKVRAKQRWGKLSEQGLEHMKGKREDLRAAIEEAYGIGNEDAEHQIIDWQGTLGEPAPTAR